MTNQELAESYRATTYVVDAPGGGIGIRIGEPSAALDALLEQRGADNWALVTAWNPGSMHLPPAENQRNNADLLERLARMGYAAIPGRGAADDGGWMPEESFFIPGIAADAAIELGRYYRQRAVVVGHRGQAARLAWC